MSPVYFQVYFHRLSRERSAKFSVSGNSSYSFNTFVYVIPSMKINIPITSEISPEINSEISSGILSQIGHSISSEICPGNSLDNPS